MVMLRLGKVKLRLGQGEVPVWSPFQRVPEHFSTFIH